MIAFATLLFRLIGRPLLREKVRTALVLIAVALGVAVVVAIDVSGDAAASDFRSALESMVGKNDLLLTATGGMDENILAKLVALPFNLDFTPRIEDFAFLNGKGEAIPFLGVDVIGYANQHPFAVTTQAQDMEPNQVWTTEGMGLRAGESVTLLINSRLHSVKVAGVLAGDFRQQKMIVADMPLAQQLTGKVGRLDSIDVKLPSNSKAEDWVRKLRQVLPVSVSVQPQGVRTDQNRRMLGAFRWNLHILSYIALLVGGFLIYNTISVPVARRRRDIGVLRALGASRDVIRNGFLLEACLLAAAGSFGGVWLGRWLAAGTITLIGSTVQALYVTSQSAPVHLTWSAVWLGMAMGIGVSLLAALTPAIEASQVSPAEAMARGRKEYAEAMRVRATFAWTAGALTAAGVCALLPPVGRKPVFGYASVLFLVAGVSLLIPGSITLAERWSRGLLQRALGVEAAFAMRSLRGSLGRSSIICAALATAIAMTAAIGIMVGSFRETVWLWMNNQLVADFYLRPAGNAAADRHPTIPAVLADEIQRLQGVMAVDRFRAYPITFDGVPATLAAGETGTAKRLGHIRLLPGENTQAVLNKLSTGNYALVSEPFSNKHKVRSGSVIELPLAGAMRRFTVLGVYYDYSTERGFIILDRNVLLKFLPDAASSSLAVYLAPGASPSDVRKEIDGVLRGNAVLVFSNATLRRDALATFDRTFMITYALEIVAIAVAVLGIAGALMALVIDRRREYALLRFLGAAKGQIRGIILCEAGLLGLFANVIGLVLGTGLSVILIYVINKQSFGWTIQFHWPVLLLFFALTGIYAATVLAGLYPARVATRLNPVEVIHEE